jgi:hypothetical protein
MGQSKYGLEVDQLSAHGQAAVRAAEQLGARTVIYRDKLAVAVLVPAEDMERLDPPDPGAKGSDPLLALCGKCENDAFVDQFNDLSKTNLFDRTLSRGTKLS